MSTVYSAGLNGILKNPYPYTYQIGDQFNNGMFNGTNVEGWRCIQTGNSGKYTEGRTATKTGVDGIGNAIIKLSGTNTQIGEGFGITVGGVYAVVVRYGANPQELILDRNISAINAKLDYSPPKFKSYGNPSGTTSQRPVLTADDAGQMYFDKTLGIPVWWNGSSWRKADGSKG